MCQEINILPYLHFLVGQVLKIRNGNCLNLILEAFITWWLPLPSKIRTYIWHYTRLKGR